MIFPTKVVRGLDERMPTETWVFSRQDLNLNARTYNSSGIKVGPIFIAGLQKLTLYYQITGAGNTTIRTIPMDEVDELELPFQFTILSNVAPGTPGYAPIDLGSIIATSCIISIVSTSVNTVYATIFGRSS